MDFAEIPYRKLSETEKTFAISVLSKANQALLKWSKSLPSVKFRALRNAAMQSPETILLQLNPEQQAEFCADLPVIQAVRKNHSELSGRSVEEAMLEGFSALAKRHARMWTKDNTTTGLTFEDFLQEAYIQIVESIYRYNDDGRADICTYIFWSLKNRLSNVTNQQGSFLSHLSNASISLLSKFNKAKQESVSGASFDDIAKSIDLSDEDKLHLTQVLKRATPASSFMQSSSEGEAEACHDYTAYRININENIENDVLVEKLTTQQILDRSNLNSLERELIETAMNPYRGWQTAVGQKHIAPRTGKPYGRMRITQILKVARKKVAATIAKINDQE